MQGITLFIAIVSSFLALILPPVYALAAYIATLIWYPDYLRVSIGTIDISAGRIVVTVLLLRCLFTVDLRRRFAWSVLDTWVSVVLGVMVFVYCITNEQFSVAIENRGGFLIDTWFAYLVARLCVTDKSNPSLVVKVVAIVLLPLSVLGVIETTTGWQPFLFLRQYCPWRFEISSYSTRWGMARAWGPFSHPIMFGACFVMFLPLIWDLRHQRDYWGKITYPLCGMVIIGALSSMSSGPWGMLVAVIFCLGLEKWKRYTKVVLVLLVVLCILAEIGSNRSFHHVVLSYINLGQGDYWSRARLIDAAIDNFGEWWLAGYGGKDPGWGSREGGYFWGDFTDVNNEFILFGVEAGILAVISLCGVFVVAFRGLVHAAQKTRDLQLKSFYWSFGSFLVGVIIIWQVVSFFGQMVSIFYCILGMIGSSISLVKYPNHNGYRLVRNCDNRFMLLHQQIRAT